VEIFTKYYSTPNMNRCDKAYEWWNDTSIEVVVQEERTAEQDKARDRDKTGGEKDQEVEWSI
jgi:hypothetical protein